MCDTQLTAAVETLDATLASKSEYPACRVDLLAAAAAQAGETLRPSLVARALALVSHLADEEDRARALGALASVLDDFVRRLLVLVNVDLSKSDVVLGEKTLGLTAVAAPSGGIEQKLHHLA